MGFVKLFTSTCFPEDSTVTPIVSLRTLDVKVMLSWSLCVTCAGDFPR